VSLFSNTDSLYTVFVPKNQENELIYTYNPSEALPGHPKQER
jgi:hypothetical protein